MSDTESVTLSVTGLSSHPLAKKRGVGSVSIRRADGRDGTPDLVVGPDDRIDWRSSISSPCPRGDPWPRHIRYEGNDPGFFEWSRLRPIESLSWTPAAAVDIDASGARISRLFLTLRRACGPAQHRNAAFAL